MDKKILSSFLSFVGKISAKDRLAILHDTDADGISAAVIAAKSVQRIRGKKPDLVFTQFKRMVSIEPATLKILKRKKINKLIVLDLAVDQNPVPVKQIEKFAEILILDHHKIYHNMASKKTTFVKAGMLSKNIEPSKYATAKLAFDLFSKIVDLKDFAWVACVGLVGDFSVDAWKKFVDDTLKENELSFNHIKSCTELVNSVETIHIEDVSELFDVYFNASHPNELLDSKFACYKEKVEEEISRLLGEFNHRAEIFPEQELVFFEFSSKYAIKSPLVNRLSARARPNQTIVIVEDAGNGVLSLSARRQDYKVAVNDLLEKAVKGIKGGIAGGHVPAAGGKIPKKALGKFKENLIRILSKKAVKK